MQSHNSESDAIKHLSMLDPQVVIDQNGVGVLADEPHHDQSDRDGNLPDARGDITRFPPKDSALQFFGTRETSSFRGPLYTGLNERAVSRSSLSAPPNSAKGGGFRNHWNSSAATRKIFGISMSPPPRHRPKCNGRQRTVL
ncbi:hypothetical protein GY45DRAFT_614771 [Cubamyces sp. BRFM 1775]|nr:hypothetical protein GY45DRAFT_614771 [Cubamyces sp. BRFM 1775]